MADLGKILSNVTNKIASTANAKATDVLKKAANITKGKELLPETIQKFSDALTSQGKAQIKLGNLTFDKSGKFITTTEDSLVKEVKKMSFTKSPHIWIGSKSTEPSHITSDEFVRTLAKESIINQVPELAHEKLTPQEAVNGARALRAAVGEFAGKSAEESAKVFEEKGISQIEHKLNLRDKYGNKGLEALKQKAEAKEYADGLMKAMDDAQEVNRILNKK